MYKNTDKFVLRKLTIGLVSVALGLVFAGSAKPVHADVNTPQTQETVKQDKGQDNNNSQTFTVAKNSQPVNSNEAKASLAKSQAAAPAKTSYTASASYDTQDNTTKTNLNKNAQVAGQDKDLVNVHVSISNGTKDITKTSPITIHTSVQGTNDNSLLHVDTNVKSTRDWNITYASNNTYSAYYIGTGTPAGFDFTYGFTADGGKIQKPIKITPAVTITFPNKQVTKTALKPITYTPYQEKINQYHLVDGFKIGDTTVGSEQHWGNIGASDMPVVLANGGANPSHKIYQYGLYFNYSKVLAHDLSHYLQAVFDAEFKGDQRLLGSSIKVFKVPDNLLRYPDGDRIKIGDPLKGTRGTVYDYITSYNAHLEDTQLEKYLRKLADEKGNVMQFAKDGKNTPFDDNSAYFIQVDTIATNGTHDPLLTTHYEGSGETLGSVTFDYNTGTATASDVTTPSHPANPGATGQKTKPAAKPGKPEQPGQKTDSNGSTQASQTSQTTQASQPPKPVAPSTVPVPPKSKQDSTPVAQSTTPSKPSKPSKPVQGTTPAPVLGKDTGSKHSNKKTTKTLVPPLKENRNKSGKKGVVTSYIPKHAKKPAGEAKKQAGVATPVKTKNASQAKNESQAGTLPQTGNSSNNLLAMLGLAVLSLTGLFAKAFKHNN